MRIPFLAAAVMIFAACCNAQTSGSKTTVLVRVAHGFERPEFVSGVDANGSANLYYLAQTPESAPGNKKTCVSDYISEILTDVAASWGLAEVEYGDARMASQTSTNASYTSPNFIISKTEHSSMIQATVCLRQTPPAIFQNEVVSGGKARYSANYDIIGPTKVLTEIIIQHQTDFQSGCEKIKCRPDATRGDSGLPVERIDACRIIQNGVGQVVGVVTTNESATYFGATGTYQYDGQGRLILSSTSRSDEVNLAAGQHSLFVETFAIDRSQMGDIDGVAGFGICDLIQMRGLISSGPVTASSIDYRIAADLNIDGINDLADETLLLPSIPRLPGDFTGDYYANTADLVRLMANFGASPATYSMGDMNEDNSVNSSDLTQFLGQFGAGTPSFHPDCFQ